MTWLAWLHVLEWAICIAMIPVIVGRRMMPGVAVAWLAVIFFQPILGLLLYLLLGTALLGRRRRRMHRRVIAERRNELPFHRQVDDPLSRQMRDQQIPMMIQTHRIFGMPMAEGNDVTPLDTYDRYIDQVIDDIRSAAHHVHLIFYIFQPDETGNRVAEALMDAAQRGVTCRLIADHAGSRALFARRGLASRMRVAGVDVRAALPVSPLRRRFERLDMRNHRKLLVVDGRTAVTGSHNIVDMDYEGDQRLRLTDLSVRVTGPVVPQLQVVFVEDWGFETGQHLDGSGLFPEAPRTGNVMVQTVPSGPTEESETFHRVVLAAINSARTRLIMTTPYFVPDEPTLIALSMAAYRGVDVQLVTSARSDYAVVSAAGRSYFKYLMDFGASIHLFEPGLLHAKTLTIDDSFAMVGTANFDIRSFVLNFELNLLLYGSEVTRRLRDTQKQYKARSQRIDPVAWRQRPRLARFAEDAAALLSPLL